jgi:hypothetical protein
MNREHGTDRVVHTGNFTDGKLDYAALQSRVASLKAEALRGKTLLHMTLGELDANVADGNPERLSLLEQSRIYMGRNLPRYFEDVKDKHLRLIFLDSYDADQENPYGYSDACVDWLGWTLADMPPARRVLIFSHIPPTAHTVRGVEELRGEARMIALLGEYSGRVLAFFCGHGDEDYLDNEGVCPVVCRAGSDVPSWDAVIVDAASDTVRSVRFGEGREYLVENGEARWL